MYVGLLIILILVKLNKEFINLSVAIHLTSLIPNKKMKFYCSFIKLSRRITLEVSFSQEKYLFATQTNCLTISLEKLTG
jgi:hypothetical protein